jgi:hypothetical protein
MPVPRGRRSLPVRPAAVCSLALTCSLLLSACAAGGSGRAAAPAAAARTAPQDPLRALADARSDQYDDASGRLVLHRSGQGPASFTVARPDGASGIRFYVSCSPDSRFRVSMGTFFSGPCSTRFQNSGRIPLGPAGQPLLVTLDVPRGTYYWIVGLAVA